MKKITLLLLLTSNLLFGQNDSNLVKLSIANLKNVKDIFTFANFDKTTWSLWTLYNQKKYAPNKAENIKEDIDKYLLKYMSKEKNQEQNINLFLIDKYKNNITAAFNELKILSSDQLGEFLYSKEATLPLQFGLTSDTSLSFIITGTYIDNVYNTLKFTSRQRASQVITSYIIPSIKKIAKSFNGEEIKYFGMTCVYGSRDFSESITLSTKPEFIAFLAPMKIINKYIAGDITEDSLIESSEIFVCDRDMIAEIKKIKIKLE